MKHFLKTILLDLKKLFNIAYVQENINRGGEENKTDFCKMGVYENPCKT